MKLLLSISKAIDAVTELFGRIAQWIVPLVIVVGFLNVLMRKLGEYLKTDIYGALTQALTGRAVSQNQVTEVQWYLFSLLFFFGFAYILRHGVNVRVDFLYARWSPKRRALVDLAGSLLFLIPFCLLGIYVAIPQVAFSWGCFSTQPPGQLIAFLGNLTCAGEPEIGSDPGSLQRHLIKTCLLIALGLLLLQGIAQAIKNAAVLTGHTGPDVDSGSGQNPAHEITEVEERMRKVMGN